MAETGADGRRARKKARTRSEIADAALRLFLARGFEQVTIAEIAEAADVSVATVFNHFSSKEALVLDEDGEREAKLVAAVRDRRAGSSVVAALHEHFAAELAADIGGELGDGHRQFWDLVRNSESLRGYAQRMWTRHEDSLAAAIAADGGLDAADPSVRALAHFAVESLAIAKTGDRDPRAVLDAAFTILREGWQDVTRT
ncbi:helix-turn-helix domain-containing protein [Actinospica sp.]|jgi:AcrR family transcriptional regulator|uniref:TetR/AcrR family transcriptional regulator n=1 Tax=Actinospica sp. TaxID=1872142 RepID=UPI002BAE1277|nr:helix-turn-helix domain-containing protein [Actinospica sp.]HWG23789.1 helix-turn-helix domain-containing protein [Actinospica sp.]